MLAKRNLGMELVRATEAAALRAGRWMGRGSRERPDVESTAAMVEAFDLLDIDGYVVIGEKSYDDVPSPLAAGQHVGTGDGPEMDVVLDAIDGRALLAAGRDGAIAVAAIAPRGCMWSPEPAQYMEKIVVNRDAAEVLVPECLDAPAAWTLSLIARVKDKEVRDLVVFVLDRTRHRDLIAEIRAVGARVMLRSDGDIAGALQAALPDGRVDVLMGVGGVAEGVIAACGIRAIDGAMLGRLRPQSDAEREAVKAAGLDTAQVLTAHELVTSDDLFFAATGITDGPLLHGVEYQSRWAQTHSLVLRGATRRRRLLITEHLLEEGE